MDLNLTGNLTLDNNVTTDKLGRTINWGVLALIPLIGASTLGNILVCLAVCWERRLQNMTNYFLMSLAIADLLVSLLVMPIGLIVELFGYFPLQPGFCVLWATMDVLLCTASIWHMCTMSMDRFCTLKYPMKYGRNKTKTMVALKITFVWIISIAICCPLCIMGFVDYNNVFIDGQCVPTIGNFVIYGSIFAFYVPLLIMVITYGLTIQILCTNQKLMKSVVRDHRSKMTSRVNKANGDGNYNGSFLSPYIPRLLGRASIDNSISNNASATYVHSTSESCLPRDTCNTHDTLDCSSADKSEVDGQEHEQVIPIVTAPSDNSIESDKKGTFNVIRSGKLSISQPHLPSMSDKEHTSPTRSHRSLVMPRAISQLGVHDLESVQNFEFVSAATSLNSMLSREQFGSCSVWSEFNEPEMFEKLSQIEAEMDECLKSCSQEKSPEEFYDCEATEATSLLSVFSDTKESLKDDVRPERRSTSSTSSLGKPSSTSDTGSGNLITIQLKPSGCYLYQVSNGDAKTVSNGGQYALIKGTDPLDDADTKNPKTEGDKAEGNGKVANGFLSPPQEYHIEVSPAPVSGAKTYSASAWKAFVHRKKKQKVRKSKDVTMISKRTASNERKASKVLGIIFAVFVILWTPFFIVNILSVACEECRIALTPPMMASIVWLGYMSSLANPIIYTMFNTAFRHSFYKILTCSYKHRAVHGHSFSALGTATRRHRTPENLYMTNMTSNCNWTSSDRRNTIITVTMEKK